MSANRKMLRFEKRITMVLILALSSLLAVLLWTAGVFANTNERELNAVVTVEKSTPQTVSITSSYSVNSGNFTELTSANYAVAYDQDSDGTYYLWDIDIPISSIAIPEHHSSLSLCFKLKNLSDRLVDVDIYVPYNVGSSGNYYVDYNVTGRPLSLSGYDTNMRDDNAVMVTLLPSGDYNGYTYIYIYYDDISENLNSCTIDLHSMAKPNDWNTINIGEANIRPFVYNEITYMNYQGQGNEYWVDDPNAGAQEGYYDYYPAYYIPLSIPKDIRRIDYSDFPFGKLFYSLDCHNYTRLTTVILPEALPAGTTVDGKPVGNRLDGKMSFSGCTSLTSFIIQGETKRIVRINETDLTVLTPHVHGGTNYGTFQGCTNLTRVYLPDSITTIGQKAFLGCENLGDYGYPFSIPSGVTSIGELAFSGCTVLGYYYSITIPDGVTTIIYNAFYGTGIKDLDLNNVTYVAAGAFGNCNSLESIKVSSGVQGFDDGAFSGCLNLTEVTIDSSFIAPYITEDDKDYYFGHLLQYATDIYILDGITPSSYITTNYVISNDANTAMSGYTHYVLSVTKYTTNGITYTYNDSTQTYRVISVDSTVTSLDLTNTSSWHDGSHPVTSIKSMNFTGYTNLTSVTVPNNITIENGEFSFSGCSSLTSVNIPTAITSIGENTFNSCSSLQTINIHDNVTTIANNAFSSCSNLNYYEYNNAYYLGNSTNNYVWLMKAKNTSISSCTINPSTKKIFYRAFYNCQNLTSINIPDSVTNIDSTAFNGCAGLTTITCGNNNSVYTASGNCLIASDTVVLGCQNSVIPTSDIDTIGNYAFYGQSAMTNIVIPANITSIGAQAFNGCSGLSRVYYGGAGSSNWDSITIATGNTPLISATRYYYSATEPTTAGNFWYYDNGVPTVWETPENLFTWSGNTITGYTGSNSTVIIPSRCTAIGKDAFKNNSTVTDVIIQNGVRSIGNYAFYYCSNLKSIIIPESVTRIGDYAFWDTAITSLDLPTRVNNINYSTFYCSNRRLESITVAEGNQYYHSENNCLIETATNTLILGCKNSIIPTDGSVTIIGQWAFVHSNLTEITIPSAVTTIGDSAFMNCSLLESITIQNGLTTIGDNVFLNCRKLTSITIPQSVTTIGTNPFLDCSKLSSIIVDSNNTSFCSKGNCLIQKSNGKLISGCKTSVIPTDGSVLIIGEGAFYYTILNIDLYIPDGVTTIGKNAFVNTALKSIYIPASVTSIVENPFHTNNGITSITVDQANTTYHSDGNCLIHTASNTLVVGCKNSIIPSDGSVTSIGKYAFDSMGITSIVIPSSIVSISAFAFYSGTTKPTVYYGGATASDWNNITIGSYNTRLTNATRYYYSETQPQSAGNYWHYVNGEPTPWS